MKASQFNEYIGKRKKGWVIYNNLTGAMIEVPEYIYAAIHENNINKLTNIDILSTLKLGHFIVHKDENEIKSLSNKRDELNESPYSIGFQILSTMSCNFRCVYCYEGSHPNLQFMSLKVMDAIINHLKTTIRLKPTIKYLNICWYGGEPLLSMKQIEYLSSSFLDICNENNIQYFSSIVTNGYLLTRKNLDILSKLKVSHCQVTLDGPEHIHNKRRLLKNGSGTYRRILNNLKYTISRMKGITVRVNIDNGNIFSVKDLFLDLQKNNILDNVKISLGRIQNIGTACRSIEENILSAIEATNILRSLNIETFLKKTEKIKRPVPNLLGCIAKPEHSMIIGPGGELYKCSKTIGDEKEICGTIFAVDNTHPNFRKWVDEDRLKIEQCKKCSMVPICGGNGCTYDFLIKNRELKRCNKKERHDNYLKTLKILHQQKN